MDKKKFNNEIILCRSAVKKAKVAVVRKLIEQIKKLKKCKVEGLKEKKQKKAERLFKVVQAIKKLKIDEVTKFALRHKDFDEMLKKRNLKVKKKGLIHLAKHKALEAKVNSIREKIPDWETAIPVLLDSSKKKKKEVVATNEETEKSDVNSSKPVVKPKKIITSESKVKNSFKETKLKEEPLPEVKKVEKMDDPFFIAKKIDVPKLLLESASERKSEKKIREVKPKWEERSISMLKPFKGISNRVKIEREKPRYEPVQVQEKLHPSWEAKKVKLIKPFEGKKIKFSDD